MTDERDRCRGALLGTFVGDALGMPSAARERLEAIVAAESQCCPFSEFGLVRQDDALVLSIDAPAGAERVLDDLLTACASPPRTV